MGSAVDILDRLHLTRAQAIGLFTSLALEFRRIELALLRRADDAVLDAVIHIACGKHGIVHQLNEGITQNGLSIVTQKTPFGPEATHRQITLIHIRSAGNDAVKVPGKALRFDHGLIAACRTSHEVRLVWWGGG